MRDDDFYDDIPYAAPAGVSPAWRLLALVSAVAALGLLALVGVLAGALALLNSARPSQLMSGQFRDPGAWVPPGDDETPVDPGSVPYPVVQDLRPPGSVPALDGEPVPAPGGEARGDLMKAAEVVWRDGPRGGADRALVSPDGTFLAVRGFEGVRAGRLNGPMAALDGPGRPESPGNPLLGRSPPGVGSWSADGATLYWTLPDGELWGDSLAGRGTVLPPAKRGRAVAELPGGGRFVLVRARSGVTLGGADPDEVVLAGAAGDVGRTLIPAGRASWRDPAPSPDGTLLALVSGLSHEDDPLSRWRVFVLDLKKGDSPRPLTPPAPDCGPLCWTPDGKLLYARFAGRPPEGDLFPGEAHGHKLYEIDPVTGRETRLSGAEDVSSPSVTRDGTLYFLSRDFAPREGMRAKLMRLPLAKARELAAARAARPDTLAAWVKLAGDALAEAKVPADATPARLNEGLVKSLAAAFGRLHRERFGRPLPDTAAGLDRLRSDLDGFDLPRRARTHLALVHGAAAGDYLCRRHGACWSFAEGPAGDAPAGAGDDDLFRAVANPFNDLTNADDLDPEDRPPMIGAFLNDLLERADGRPLVLTPRPGHLPAVPPDPDLARGAALLGKGQGEEGDKVLLGLSARHSGNLRLALHVGSLLHEHGRADALGKLLGKLAPDRLKDARAYNLLGASLLPGDPAAAAEAFKKAIRCDLGHTPAYLNLAHAFLAQGNREAARLCLRHVAERYGFAPSGVDARRRLAEMDEGSVP